ncbi:MAG TPA: type II toxin-antitoxin system RelE/ParE family toxin [Streptosporangiaceae bacterium]
MALPVAYHPQYEAEWRNLPSAERAALASAVEKLRADSRLGFPHTSLVQGSRTGLRELRPRRGRSPWRALYRRAGDVMVVLAVAPEAGRDHRGFGLAVAEAERRLRELEV